MDENSSPPVAPAPAATADASPGADSFGTAALKAAERRRRMALRFAIAAGIVALLTGLIALVKYVASERTYSEVARAAARQAPPAAPSSAAPSALALPAAPPPVQAGAPAPPSAQLPPAQPADAVPPAAPTATPSVAAAGVPAAAEPVAANASKAPHAKVRKTAGARKKRAPRDDTFKRCPPLGKKGAVMCRWHICNGGAGKEAACRPYLERAP